MPVGAILMVTEGDAVFPGDVLARIPRETTKTKDITGGLPAWPSSSRCASRRKTPSLPNRRRVSFGKDTRQAEGGRHSDVEIRAST